MIIVGLIFGLAALAVSAWFRAGKSPRARAWARGKGMFDAHFALLLFPGLGVAVLGLSLVGILQMVHGPIGTIGSVLALLLTLAGAACGVWGLFSFRIPPSLYPEWARDDN
ncbi:hypothetical protein QP400_04040 [Winkia sp. UMB3158]|uniref:Uncharacterized protein n=2 Tax=Bacillati TaxID=1783272 RepID=A0AB38XN53_9ACTO|nr:MULTISPECIES: hypothetical protein [Winkia]MDK8224814.1 hypothetical protein [Winkia sp. UMB750B]MDK8341920.1 hypothetical protein [Winkia sp. UMB3164B]PLB79846.1 hypothetical protein CYJ21_09055 [Actinomyces sp. UMB0138]PMC93829.1 hypothetical protein CJ188_00885 [Actinomyces sp. UMB0918]MBS5947708.1 hypothetical protein [Winkia neuii]